MILIICNCGNHIALLGGFVYDQHTVVEILKLINLEGEEFLHPLPTTVQHTCLRLADLIQIWNGYSWKILSAGLYWREIQIVEQLEGRHLKLPFFGRLP